MFHLLLLTSVDIECRQEIYKAYNFYWDLPFTCRANMTLFDPKWSLDKVRFERSLLEKKCKHLSTQNRQIFSEKFDDILYQLQTFQNDLVNAANFCNCLHGMGNTYDLQSWWKQSIETKILLKKDARLMYEEV